MFTPLKINEARDSTLSLYIFFSLMVNPIMQSRKKNSITHYSETELLPPPPKKKKKEKKRKKNLNTYDDNRNENNNQTLTRLSMEARPQLQVP
jgi:hypothetical protein